MKRLAVLLPSAAAVVALVVTLSSGKNDSAQAAVKRAAAKTADVRSSRFTITMEAPDGATFPTEGVMDYVDHRGRISFGGESEMLFDGNVVYVLSPIPGRKERMWLRSRTDWSETDPFSVEDRIMRNPTGLLEFLSGVGSDVREVGLANVRGAATRHYEGTVDFQNVVDQAPAAKRAELQAYLDFIAKLEPTKVPFELWVDGDGVARRLHIEGQGAPVTVEYFDFGVAVEITAPPASQVISERELFEAMEQHKDEWSCDEAPLGSADIQSGSLDETQYCIVSTVSGG